MLNYKVDMNDNSAGLMCKSLCEGIWKVGYINRAIQEALNDYKFNVLMTVR